VKASVLNERIKKLRKQSRSATPYLSLERALLITEFYKKGAAQLYSYPVSRAKAFQYIMEHKEICLNDGELIVGERGPEPKATPSYPEVCCHSLNDLKILDTRGKISFKVTEEVWRQSKDIIIPFWKGKTIREKIFSQVDPEWIDAYSAGIFTEFMEQRAPGHTVAGKNIWNMGFLDFKKLIQKSIDNLDFFSDPDAFRKREQLKAMDIAADSIIHYAKRYSKKALKLAEKESDPLRKRELEKIAEICEYVPANAPRTFWEALQHYWFIHLGVITEYNTWDSFNPGRLDQHLYPFYKKDIADRILTKESAIELLQAFWIKFNNQPAPPKVGVTAEESGTYTDFCNINLGGLKEDGSDGVNELSYMLLDVIEEMRILQPSSNIQISEKTPDEFIKRALKIIKTGFGQPSVFNADMIIQELTRQGKSLVDARNGGASGCVETGAFGKEAYILTGYFNLVKILEITLNNGYDPLTNKQIGLNTGDPISFKTFEELLTAYSNQIKNFIDIKIKGNLIIERIWAQNPSPFLSILIDDCIKNGKDYNDGGAKYNTSYIQIVGMGTITDCLTALKYNIFDKKIFTMNKMLEVLKNNFQGFEEVRQKLISKTPKYGNDDDYADSMTQQVFEIVYRSVDGRPNTKGGVHRINLLPTTVHIYFGKVTGATPDGRKAQLPLSEGISPVQGMDINGPTSVIKSAGKIDHLRTGGTLLNQKFSPKFFSNNSGITNLAHLIRSYFKMGGHHIQFNVVSANTLRAAQEHPEEYQNLIVRVAGYSDYYNNLGKILQDEIIRRTEHNSI
jgi:pyruvate formate-lyase/glycerol dehydratase family glycyl radical enzyme